MASCGNNEPAADGGGSVEKITLRVSDSPGSDEGQAAMTALDAAFMEQNPDIIIDRSSSPYDENFAKLTTAIAAQD